MTPNSKIRFTDSDHLFAYYLHMVTGKKVVKLKDSDYKLIALSRRTKRTRASWSRKVGNFDAIRDGGSQTGDAEQVYAKFKSEYEGNPTDAMIRISEELEPFSDDAKNLFLKIGIPGNLLKTPSVDSKHPYFSVIQKSDIMRASEMMLEGEFPSGFNESNIYDVIVKGKAFAPKPLVAIAYKLAGGLELRGADFEGGQNTECFNCLEKYDFKLILKQPNTDPNNMNVVSNLNAEQRLVCALAAKPFVILAGGTGTGKSMAALNVAKKLSPSVDNYVFIAVGADWTDTRPLLGYENILRAESTYTVPKALEIIIEASRKPQEPFFIILDEMNLSHVERYFSDFLSIMEAKKVNREASTIKLHSRKDGMRPTDGNLRGGADAPNDLRVPDRIEWPSNLFVIGTVNVDETTHMFSPKVLDRAHVIEFRPGRKAVGDGIVVSPAQVNAGEWSQIGFDMVSLAGGFLKDDTAKRNFDDALAKAEQDAAIEVILDLWDVLEGTRFKFSYRTSQEALKYVRTAKWLTQRHAQVIDGNTSMDALVDLAVLQKILPKINGSAETLMTRPQPTNAVEGSRQEAQPLLRALLNRCEKLNESKAKLKSMQDTLDAEHFVSFIQ